jgi:hypothetical protein
MWAKVYTSKHFVSEWAVRITGRFTAVVLSHGKLVTSAVRFARLLPAAGQERELNCPARTTGT